MDERFAEAESRSEVMRGSWWMPGLKPRPTRYSSARPSRRPGLQPRLAFGVALLFLTVVTPRGQQAPPPPVPSFERDVRPLLTQTCQGCHNERVLSGGLDITPLLDPASIVTKRDAWERIVVKVHGGEMPPKGIAKPPAE